MLPRYSRLESIEIVAETPRLRMGLHAARSMSGGSNSAGRNGRISSAAAGQLQLTTWPGNLVAMALPVRALCLRASAAVRAQRLGNQAMADGGGVGVAALATHQEQMVLWDLQRGFLRGLGRANTMTCLDLRHR